MDMFDFDKIVELIKLEPGHGLIQTILLLVLCFLSNGVKREIGLLKQVFAQRRAIDEKRFENIESRLVALEHNSGKA